ncbi:TrmH family RNA methyltransferase [Nocardia sp. CA-290969]|uniref:TrmH family RNA methyltransferase n=1 Tax=Nocardia sp. CA-290969 TaxID=3239986 RepID=UPI003D8D4688
MTRQIHSRNAAVQVWTAYLDNRTKRTRDGRFLVHGVRPITQALANDWPLETLLYRLGDNPGLSAWARETLDRCGAPAVGLAPELMAELGEKSGGAPELVAVAEQIPADLGAYEAGDPGDAPVVVVFDRPNSPGNLGTLIRSADAFGVSAVVVSGHGADQYDPRCVRASTGSLFSIPVFRVAGPAEVLDFRDRQIGRGIPTRLVGTDERGARAVFDQDLRDATILVLGNETSGMSAAWSAACDDTVSIPMGGSASSLNAPSAAAVALYEISRQRRTFAK